MNRRSGRWLLFSVCCLWAVGCATVTPIEQEQVYRTTNWKPVDLAAELEEKGIRSVVNVSGFEPDAAWYGDLFQATSDANVRLIDVTVNPQGPDREEVIRLLEVFETAPKPMLLYARWSWDGLDFASALYRLTEMNEDKRQVRKDLHFWKWRRSPIQRFQYQDRFFYEWRNEDEFFATYQLSDEAIVQQRELQRRRRETKPTLQAPVSVESKDAPTIQLGRPF